MDKKLVGLLYENEVSHTLAHALLELAQLLLLVQERLSEIFLVLL